MAAFDSVHEFWFGTHPDDALVAQMQTSLWWSKKTCIDHQIRDRFADLVELAGQGRLDGWNGSPVSTLALILLTDQFPRNIYRDTAQAFQYDAIALKTCLDGLDKGFDGLLRPIERVFFYLPLEHAESLDLQERSVALFTRLCRQVPAHWSPVFDGFLDYAIRHRDIIERFGRFPHRNPILGRAASAEEIQFMKQPGSSF